MITTILTFHLAMAALYLLMIIVIGLASIVRKSLSSAVKVASGSFGAIIVSGIGLVALSPKALTQFCASALIASVCGVAVSLMYKRRVVAFHAA